MTPAVLGVVLVLLGAGCGSDDKTTAGGTPSLSTGGQATTQAGSRPAGDALGIAEIPPLLDPAPALPCDGSAVLCVDGGAGSGARDGTAAAPYATVGNAIAAATRGTVVQVAAGIYDESLVITDVTGLRLVGGFPAGGDFSSRDARQHETVLQGSSSAAVVAVTGSSQIHIEGFRITGGGGHSDGYRYEGGGVYVDQTAADVTIAGNRIDGNAADQGDSPTETWGGGIASYASGLRIVGNVIEGNRAGRGGAISAIGRASIERNVVRDNTIVGDHGAGIYAAGALTIVANHVEGNALDSDYGWGGGILVFGDETSASLRGNVVTGNEAPSAGSGVFVDDGADATLVNELYYANACSHDGGQGLFVDSGGVTPTVANVVNVTIAAHDCPDSYHGGNAVLANRSDADSPQPEVTVTSSILWGNAARDVRSLDARVTVTYTLSEEGVGGPGNVNQDPRFVDASGGDFHLRAGSPAIDAGDPAADYTAEPNPNGSRIDIGHTGNSVEATVSR